MIKSTRCLLALYLLTTFALLKANAEVIERLSFGHREGTIQPSLNLIPGWKLLGENYSPALLSDRVTLTPPYPGNKRGALWADEVLDYPEWTVEFEFRATGPERGSGNLQIWYTRDGQGLQSIYTAPQFDGLVLMVDQYARNGGSIRGFLNDGSISFKDHHNVDTLSFGHCQHPYRNLGRPTQLRLTQSAQIFEVVVDEKVCFKSDRIRLPSGYYFGVSAASAETPDSFEVMKFAVSSSLETPPVQENKDYAPQGNQGNRIDVDEDSFEYVPDIDPAIIKLQDQFGDLHNRLQVVNHQVNNVFNRLSTLSKTQEKRHVELMQRLNNLDKIASIERRIQNVEGIVYDIHKEVEARDYNEHLKNIQATMKDTHSNLVDGLPETLSNIVVNSTPKMGLFLGIVFAFQVVLLVGYVIYRRRREKTQKKYL